MSTEREDIRREMEEEDLAALHAKYSGFKPLMIWYSVWAGILTWMGFALFATKDGGLYGLVALGMAVASALYARCLFHGGLHRVWFFVF